MSGAIRQRATGRGLLAGVAALIAVMIAGCGEGDERVQDTTTSPETIEAGGATLAVHWLDEGDAAEGFADPYANAHLQYFTSYHRPEAKAAFAAVAAGDEKWITDRFRDPSDPWRIGDVPSPCGENERCASPQPTVYALVGAPKGACRGETLLTGFAELTETTGASLAITVTHQEPVSRPAWIARVRKDGKQGYLFVIAGPERPAASLSPAQRKSALQAIDGLCD